MPEVAEVAVVYHRPAGNFNNSLFQFAIVPVRIVFFFGKVWVFWVKLNEQKQLLRCVV